MTLSFRDFSEMNAARRAEQAGGGTEESWHLTEWTNALAGEAGELCNLAKKTRRARPSDPTLEDSKEAIAHELADIVTYADIIASKLDIDLGEVIREKFNIVSDRVGSKFKL
tara:strand:+ start:178 stop:513 length:336 start_codon:yes stop_codon:yes gene_type:complete